MNYAVVDIQGHQYMVSPQDTIVVDHIDSPKNENLETDKVLLYVEDNKVSVGKPYIAKMSVSYQVVSHKKGQKLDVFKFKAKSRYRRKSGFRPSLTTIKITKINTKKTK